MDERLYSREALLRACYWFTDRCYLFVTRADGGFEVHIRQKPAMPGAVEAATRLEDLAGEFANTLLDHQLRQEIELQTGGIRQVLVAKAMAEGGILDDAPPGDPRDPVDVAASAPVPGLVQLRLRS